MKFTVTDEGRWRYEYPDSLEVVRTVLGVEEKAREVERRRHHPRRAAMKEAQALLNALTLCVHRTGSRDADLVVEIEAPAGRDVGPIWHRIAELLEDVDRGSRASSDDRPTDLCQGSKRTSAKRAVCGGYRQREG